MTYLGISIGGCWRVCWTVHARSACKIFCNHKHFYQPYPPILSCHALFEVWTIKNRTYLCSWWHPRRDGKYRIAGNFWGRKLSQISRVESDPRKFSPRNLGMLHPFMFGLKQSVKVFSVKFSLPTDPRKFSPSKVYHYTVAIDELASDYKARHSVFVSK